MPCQENEILDAQFSDTGVSLEGTEMHLLGGNRVKAIEMLNHVKEVTNRLVRDLIEREADVQANLRATENIASAVVV